MACDDSDNPRFYEANIAIANNVIQNVTIDRVVEIDNSNVFLDLESILFDIKTNHVLLASEGHITNQKDPLFFSVDTSGNFREIFDIPKAFHANSLQKPRHNGNLEGLCNSFDSQGFWIAMELPLEVDGPSPKITKTVSPVRISFINANTKKPERQFAYLLDPVAKKPLLNFSVNGLTDILEYGSETFLTIERSYSSGLGIHGNTVKIFAVNAKKATNTLTISSLKDAVFKPATKTLLLDFEDLKNKFVNQCIDNIEGITMGPILPNGHRSIVLVSDNNFNTLGPQLNQFILLEVIEE